MKDFFIYSANMYLMPPVQWHWGRNTQPCLPGVYREDDEVKKKKKKMSVTKPSTFSDGLERIQRGHRAGCGEFYYRGSGIPHCQSDASAKRIHVFRRGGVKLR